MIILPKMEGWQPTASQQTLLSFSRKARAPFKVVIIINAIAFVVLLTLALSGKFVGVHLLYTILGFSAVAFLAHLPVLLSPWITSKRIPETECKKKILLTMVVTIEIALLILGVLSLFDTRFTYRTKGVALLVL